MKWAFGKDGWQKRERMFLNKDLIPDLNFFLKKLSWSQVPPHLVEVIRSLEKYQEY
jgi:hypothetical protein